jgi:hypothetical protein
MKRSLLSIAGCALVSVVGLSSCGGPERAPRQPIPGVDVRHPKGTNPHDVISSPTGQPFLGSFVEEVAAAAMAAPGLVVVLPALTRREDDGRNHVNGLGEHLATETVLRLEKRGVQALARSDVVNAMHQANLSVHFYASVADGVEIARRVGAKYVVTGTTRHLVFDNAQKRDEDFEIDWVCRQVEDGGMVARWRVVLSGGTLADDLVRHYREDSEWDQVARNENFKPSGTN